MKKYTNRSQAGKLLALKLPTYAHQPDVIILALPRGGVPVAYEIAKELSAPLDIFIVRKLGFPGQEELAIGALAMDGTTVFNEDILKLMPISQEIIAEIITKEEMELKRRMKLYRGDRPFPDLNNKTVILVDDGIATGASMRAAMLVLKKQKLKKLIVAVPVASRDTCDAIEKIADELVCPLKPEILHGVGFWYEDFSQTTDAEVIGLIKLT